MYCVQILGASARGVGVNKVALAEKVPLNLIEVILAQGS